jgi:hypothetical protein
VEHGAPIAQFDRDAPAMADAIASAVRGVESAGLRVLRVLDEDLLTLADIADRIGRSRESIRRYATGRNASRLIGCTTTAPHRASLLRYPVCPRQTLPRVAGPPLCHPCSATGSRLCQVSACLAGGVWRRARR